MRPSKGRISLWPVGVIGLVLVLAALSITPMLKLKSEPPPDFVASRAPGTAAKDAAAAAYWEVAVSVIQWKYNRASSLPEQMPEEFRLAADVGQPARTEDRAARAAYWAKLREEWLRPENWHTTISLDLSWPVRNAKSMSHDVLEFIHQS
jgi:hypothetical protein